jgi:hypothetical protein
MVMAFRNNHAHMSALPPCIFVHNWRPSAQVQVMGATIIRDSGWVSQLFDFPQVSILSTFRHQAFYRLTMKSSQLAYLCFTLISLTAALPGPSSDHTPNSLDSKLLGVFDRALGARAASDLPTFVNTTAAKTPELDENSRLVCLQDWRLCNKSPKRCCQLGGECCRDGTCCPRG